MAARLVTAALAVVIMALPGLAAAEPCAPAGSESGAVQTLKDVFAAAMTDDEAGFRQATAEDFHAYDNGRTFRGVALFELIKAAHAKGGRYVWSVTEPEVTVVCDAAFVVYVNQGAVGDANGMKPMTWLESAWLRYHEGRWRIAFLQSERAAP